MVNNIPVPWIRNGSFGWSKTQSFTAFWHLAAWHLRWLCRLCCLLLLTWWGYPGKSMKIHHFWKLGHIFFRTSSIWRSMFFWYMRYMRYMRYMLVFGEVFHSKNPGKTKKQRKWDHFQKSHQVGSYPCQVGTQKDNVSLFFLPWQCLSD